MIGARFEHVGGDPRPTLKRMTGDPVFRALSNAFRKGARRIRSSAIKGYRSTGIGRALWGKRGKGAALMVTLGRVRRQGDGVTADISSRGIAALMEEGGRTAAHVIAPKLGKSLHIAGAPSGFNPFPASVRHPGSRIPKTPALAPALEREAPAMTRAIEEAIDGLVGNA